jgi:hypothetical protein
MSHDRSLKARLSRIFHRSASQNNLTQREDNSFSSSQTNSSDPTTSSGLYQRLDPKKKSIRVVTLQPAVDSSAEVICTLAKTIVTSETYTALSYVWGDETNKQAIQVNGMPLQVPRNLYSVLKHIRSESEPILLWIDAICINQDDLDERSHQVNQMIDVYRSAKQTYIWLGDEIENLDAGLSLLNWLDSQTTGKGLEDVIMALAEFAQSSYRKTGWKAVAELVSRPWFSRVWIIQEIVYGKDPLVICGDLRFPWRLIDNLAEWRPLLYKVTWSLLKHDKPFHCGDFLFNSGRLEFLATVRANVPIDRQHLSMLVQGVRRSDAKDKRDKIYAILNLLKDDMQLCKVDYHKSIREVYTSAAIEIFNKMDSLEFLSWNHDNISRNDGYGRLPDLPSWVPSWTSPGDDIVHLHTAPASLSNPVARSLYSVTQDSRHLVSFNAASGKMQALGFVMDVLEEVSPPCDSRDGIFTGPTWLWIKSVLLNSMSGIIDDIVGEQSDPKMRKVALHFVPQFWRIVLADQWENKRLGTAPFELNGVGTIPPSSIEEAFKIRRAVSSNEFNCAFRWRSLYLAKKLVGLAPATAQPGDIIFAILGSPVPYLVRKCEGGYRLLGECYAHLMMDGQAMEGGYFNPQMITLV